LNPKTFIFFILKQAVHLSKGYILKIGNQNQIISVKSLPKCPIDLIRPGIQPQKRNGIITDILLIGGNEERLCYNYNIE
jgi:hypothetical protein